MLRTYGIFRQLRLNDGIHAANLNFKNIWRFFLTHPVQYFAYIFFFHFFTANGAYFLVQNYPSHRCLYYRDSNRVDLVRKGKCNHNYGKYYWIWTNNGQLLNWNSLKCMTNDHTTADNIHFVTMKKCDESNQKQAWRCETIHKEKYIQPKQSGRYMYDGDYGNYVTTKTIHWQSALKLRRFGTTQDVCSQGSLIVNFIT